MENFAEKPQSAPAAETPNSENSAGTPPVRIKIVGVGSAAGRTVARLCKSRRLNAEFVVVDTSAPELEIAKRISGVKTVLIGENVTGGSGAGTDATLGARAAQASEESLRAMLAGADLLVLVVSLGRGTGSGASIEVAEIARKIGLVSVCFATTPFSWEGARPTQQASHAIDALYARCNAFILIENNLLAQTLGGGERSAEWFKISDRWLESGVSACCRMLLNEKGRLHVDFAAFRSLFPRAGTRTLFSVGAGTGGNAQEAALEELFRCPLLKTRTSVAGAAEKLAIHLETGTEPPIAFVSETAQRVKDRFGGDALTIPSFSVDPALGDRIEICVFGASDLRGALRVVRPESSASSGGNPASNADFYADSGTNSGDGNGEILILQSDDGTKQKNRRRNRQGDAREAEPPAFQSEARWLFEGIDLERPTYIRKNINLDEREKQARKKAEQALGSR